MALALLPWPLLERVLDRPIASSEPATAILQRAFGAHLDAVTTELPIDVYFARELLSQSAPERVTPDTDRSALSGHLDRACQRITSAQPAPTAALYDLTHAIFYLTHFGQRGPARLGDYRPWLRHHLGALTHQRMQADDRDLGAELLLSQTYSHAGCYICGCDDARAAYAHAATLLTDAVPDDGGLAGPAWMHTPAVTDFERCYHTTLVALLALSALQA